MNEVYERWGDKRARKYGDERKSGDSKASYNILAVVLKHIAFRVFALKHFLKHARPPGSRMIGLCGFGARNESEKRASSLETSIFVRN